MDKAGRESQRLAELGYSPEYNRLELVMPYGTKVAELAKIRETLFGDLIGRLPRGCPTCISGDSLLIRERLENVLFVDLSNMKVVQKG